MRGGRKKGRKQKNSRMGVGVIVRNLRRGGERGVYEVPLQTIIVLDRFFLIRSHVSLPVTESS